MATSIPAPFVRPASSHRPESSLAGARRLEWARIPDTEFSSCAETEIGVYRTWTHHEAEGEWFWSLTGIGGGKAINGSGASEADVRLAAQTDLDGRILSHTHASRSDQTPDWLSNCCRCGRVVDTRERSEGGDDHGCELDAGGWTCSFECWEVATGGGDDDAADGTKVVERARATIQRILDATPFNTNTRDVRDAFGWFHTVAQSALDDLSEFPGPKADTVPNDAFALTRHEALDALANDYGEKLHEDPEADDLDADYAVAEEVASRDLSFHEPRRTNGDSDPGGPASECERLVTALRNAQKHIDEAYDVARGKDDLAAAHFHACASHEISDVLGDAEPLVTALVVHAGGPPKE